MHFRTCMFADREVVLGVEEHFSARLFAPIEI